MFLGGAWATPKAYGHHLSSAKRLTLKIADVIASILKDSNETWLYRCWKMNVIGALSALHIKFVYRVYDVFETFPRVVAGDAIPNEVYTYDVCLHRIQPAHQL